MSFLQEQKTTVHPEHKKAQCFTSIEPLFIFLVYKAASHVYSKSELNSFLEGVTQHHAVDHWVNIDRRCNLVP